MKNCMFHNLYLIKVCNIFEIDSMILIDVAHRLKNLPAEVCGILELYMTI